MKRVLLIIPIIFIAQSFIFPQELQIAAKKVLAQETLQNNSHPNTESRLICGTPLVFEKDKEVLQFFKDNPNLKTKFKKSTFGWGFNLGDTHNWWTVDMNSEPTSDYEVPSTCRGIGDDCYVFVADSLWHDGGFNPLVTQDHVDNIVESFSNTTANFPNMGIYDVNVMTFGEPPNIDNDERIIILILSIHADGVGGSFSQVNQFSDSDAQTFGRRSNEAEMYYMDVSGVDNVEYSRGLQAHEFQHMIHYNYDDNEATFVNEGLSMIAEYVCGHYETYYFNAYQQDPNVYLFGWRLGDDVTDDYARAALWTLYIHEQFPDGILKKIVQNTGNKNFGLDAAMNQIGSNRRSRDTFADWLVANYLQEKTVVPEYGYDYSPIAKPQATTHYITTATGGGTLKKIAAEYITFASGTPFKITFTTDPNHSQLHIRVIKKGPSGIIVETVPKDIEYDVPDFGTTYTEVTFVVYRDSEFDTNPEGSDTKPYNYVALGSGGGPVTVELAYEDGEPDGYAPPGTWANPGDSVAVKFDGITGGKLDSIRIAFRRNGTIQMDISEFDGSTFLRGNNLYGPVQVVSTDSTTIVNSSYPIPFDNWVTVDLTNQNIETSKDFVVSLLLGNNTSEPGIMVSAESTSGHSFWYATTDNTWYAYTAEGGNIWNYFIRAYVSIGGTAVLAQPTINSIIANQGNVQLSWNSSAGPVEGYNIYRSTSTGFTPDNNNKIGNVESTITNYTDALPNIQANTDYYYRISSFDGSGNESDYSEEVTTRTLDVKDKNGIPTEYSLNSNYPNPFNPSTTFRFATPKDGLVKFTVHDLLGRVIYSENRNLLAGNYSFTWHGQNQLDQQVVSGVYFLRMEAEGYSQTRKMLLLR